MMLFTDFQNRKVARDVDWEDREIMNIKLGLKDD